MHLPPAGLTTRKKPVVHFSGTFSPIQRPDRDSGYLRYHFVDFSEAQRTGAASPLPSPITPTPTNIVNDGVMKDVQDLGSLLQSTLHDHTSTKVQERFMPLVTLMTDGRISADGARVMFMDVLRNTEVEKEFGVDRIHSVTCLNSGVRPKKPSVLVKSVSSSEGSQEESGYDIMDGEEDNYDPGRPRYYYPIGTDSDDPNYDSERCGKAEGTQNGEGLGGPATLTTCAIPGGVPRLTCVEIVPKVAIHDEC